MFEGAIASTEVLTSCFIMCIIVHCCRPNTMAALAAVASLDVLSPAPEPEPATQTDVPQEQDSTDEEEQAQQLSTGMERVATPLLEQQLSKSSLSCLAIVTRVVISKFSRLTARIRVSSRHTKKGKDECCR